MCEYCHSYPHMHGCPAEREPRTIYRCKYCGESISEGEIFYSIEGGFYHKECLEDAGVTECLRIVGIEPERAEE